MRKRALLTALALAALLLGAACDGRGESDGGTPQPSGLKSAPQTRTQPTPQATEGLKGYSIQALAASGNTLYAGAWGKGVFRSEDGGQSWAYAGLASYPSNLIRALAVMGDTVYASAWGEGVFASSDGGKSWTNTKNSPKFAVSFAVSGDTLYAAGSRLKAGSDSWTFMRLPELEVSFAVLGTTIYAGTGKAGELPRVVRSQDGGNSWQAADKGLPESKLITSLAASGNSLYAAAGAAAGPKVFRSDDGGQSWTAAGAGLPDPGVRSLVALGATLYVAVGLPYTMGLPAGSKEAGLFRSEDGGRSWSEGNQGLTNLGVYSFASLGTTTHVGTADGIFRSEDGGRSWHR